MLDDNGRLLADLVGAGTCFTAAEGGRGGLATLRWRPAPARPRASRCWGAGEARDLTLELKTVADVGLIGFPSAGKSSLVSTISAAAEDRGLPVHHAGPQPRRGVGRGAHLHRRRRARPDPGASAGRGLGLDFLRHIERCAVLVHVDRLRHWNPVATRYRTLTRWRSSLAAYRPTLQGDTTLGDLADRPRAVVLKIDVPEARELADFVRPDIESAAGRCSRCPR